MCWIRAVCLMATRERNRNTRNKPSFRGTSLSDLLPPAKPSFGCSLNVNLPVN